MASSQETMRKVRKFQLWLIPFTLVFLMVHFVGWANGSLKERNSAFWSFIMLLVLCASATASLKLKVALTICAGAAIVLALSLH